MIRTLTKNAGLAVLCAFAGFLGPNAHAAVTASASIGVTDIFADGITLSNNQFLTDLSTPFQNAFDVGTVLQSNFFSTSLGGNSSYAEIDGLNSPLAATYTGATNRGFGTSTVLWTFDYTATGDGPASLDIEYLWNTTIAGYLPTYRASASASINAFIDGQAVQPSNDVLHFFDSVNGDAGGFANLLFNFDVLSGQTGTFTVAMTSVSSVAPVPLPAALPLLGSGLLGLFGLGRRRQRKLAVAA